MTTRPKKSGRTSRSPALCPAVTVAVAGVATVAAALAGTACRRSPSPDPALDTDYVALSFTTADGAIDPWRIPLPTDGDPLGSTELEHFLDGRSGAVSLTVVKDGQPVRFLDAEVVGGVAHGTVRGFEAPPDGRRELSSSARFLSGVQHGEEQVFARTEPRGLWVTATRLWEAGEHTKTTIRYPDGAPLVTFELVAGRKDGPATVRHPDGSEAFTGVYRAGSPYDGTFLADDPFPPELAEAAFRAGSADRLRTRTFSAGQPVAGPGPDAGPPTIR